MVQLLQGDCLEVMKTLPDKSVDLFLCDLPYGCLATSRDKVMCSEAGEDGVRRIVNTPCAWDIKIDLTQFWVQVKRLMKDDHTPIIHFCNTKFGFDLISSNPDWFRYDLVWSKSNGVGFLSANKMPLRSHEMIYVFAKKGARYYRKDIVGDFPAGGGGRSKSSVYPSLNDIPNSGVTEAGRRCVKSVVGIANKKGKGNHPTQKPDDLYAWLIERYSKEGDVVLDPTAGSFASVFTAERMGRVGVGIEKDEVFYAKAKSSLA